MLRVYSGVILLQGWGSLARLKIKGPVRTGLLRFSLYQLPSSSKDRCLKWKRKRKQLISEKKIKFQVYIQFFKSQLVSLLSCFQLLFLFEQQISKKEQVQDQKKHKHKQKLSLLLARKAGNANTSF